MAVYHPSYSHTAREQGPSASLDFHKETEGKDVFFFT